MLKYSDHSAYVTFTGQTPPDNFDALCRYASGLVKDATVCDRWVALPSGLPVDDELREALSDATNEQIAAWDAAGIDPQKGAGGQEARLTTTGVDGANLSYDTYLTAPDRAKMVDQLCAGAFQILRAAGLASTSVRSF
ncbi:hypothetical protein [Rhodococcoides fascians]|uniref:hypothetical protein n=1 Tax=Rhodococcoides fascians TaxID=1828 RepID=UPI00055B3181|nr:hypothetical protein [Rhodococcus fascians]